MVNALFVGGPLAGQLKAYDMAPQRIQANITDWTPERVLSELLSAYQLEQERNKTIQGE